MRLPFRFLAIIAFTCAGVMAFSAAWFAAKKLESYSIARVKTRLLNEGITWVDVRASGLQLRLHGTAPNEAERFRVKNLAASVVDDARIRDRMDVVPLHVIEAPDFSVEILRNTDGITLIGLLPAPAAGTPEAVAQTAQGENSLITQITAATGRQNITNMLEIASFPMPEGWQDALDFGVEALKILPRAKISVFPKKVVITAISESDSQKRRFEARLRDLRPHNVTAQIDISAPRPVITPFTLRFIKDEKGARFDACSAENETGRQRITTAAQAAGVQGTISCTIGLGVPSPSWAKAAEAAIQAVHELGGASVTFSDADISLLADANTPQATFDQVVGELNANLPPAFSLKATLAPKPQNDRENPIIFTADLNDGQTQLRGRLGSDLDKSAIDSFAKARFGAKQVHNATRPDDKLPQGWSVRVLAGLEALSMLHHGKLIVKPDLVELSGVTGRPNGRDRAAQILSNQLGQGKPFTLNITYDAALDPLAALPTPQECVDKLNAIVTRHKIAFTPGSAEIAADAAPVLDDLAKTLRNCPLLKMEIAGHTDAQGSSEGNLALSQNRADAVLQALNDRKAPVSAFIAKGYGEDRPIAGNDTDEGREANRRIAFTLLAPTQP